MTREKMLKAVTFGLKRGQGKDVNGMAESIITAIEIALEMDAEGGPTPVTQAVEWPIVPAPLPTPPQSVTPIGPDGGGLIDTVAESVASNPAPEMRHLPSARRTAPISVEKLIEVLHSHTPESIEITVNHPERGPRLVKLARNVIADSMAKSARLVYKHPDLSDEMAVQSVFVADGDPPNLTEALADIRRRAEKLYAPRPRHLQPAPPPPSSLDFPPMDSNRIREAQAEAATAPDVKSLSGMSFPGGFNLNRQ